MLQAALVLSVAALPLASAGIESAHKTVYGSDKRFDEISNATGGTAPSLPPTITAAAFTTGAIVAKYKMDCSNDPCTLRTGWQTLGEEKGDT